MQQAQIIELQPHTATQVINYNITDAALAELKERTSKILREWDCKDFEIIKSAKKEVLKLRTGVEPLRKQYNEEALAHQRRVNAEAKRIVTALEEMEKPLDDILDAEKARIEAEKAAKKAAEEARVNAIKAQINTIRELPFKCMSKSAEYITDTLEYLNGIIASDSFKYEEFDLEAKTVKQDSLAKLQAMLDERLTLDKRAAEEAAAAEARRIAQEEENKRAAEEAEKIRLAQEEENKRLAEERRKFEEEQAKIRKEQEEKQRLIDEENNRKAAALAEEKRKFEAEQERIRQEKEAEIRKAEEAEKLKISQQAEAPKPEEKIAERLTAEKKNQILREAVNTAINALRNFGFEGEPEGKQIIAELRNALEVTE